ncbi:MAG: hypothetical protein U0235_09780 [Polyangiaceae bacterium]
MRGLSLSFVSALGLALAACGAPANSDRDATRCAEMKSSLEGCLGGAAPDLDCATLTPSDVSRIQGAMDTFSCTGLGQGITLDGDPKSASCRMYGVGCTTATNEAPEHRPTRFPIVLVNGIDDSPLFRWSDRIQRTLREDGGHTVALATLPPWSPVKTRGPALWKRIQEVRAETHAAKVNLVCHSLGGLDCRYVASPAGLVWDADDVDAKEVAGAIASVTTVATAHHGTRAADVLMGLAPDGDRQKLADALVALLGGALGSGRSVEDPHVRDGLAAITTEEAERFSREMVDAEGVYYQSWAGYSRPFGAASAEHDAAVVRECASDDVAHDYMALPLAPFADVVGKASDGTPIPNDGLVAVASAKWGKFRGCVPADHMEQLGQRNLPDVNVRTGFDVARFYASVAADLAERGF